MNTQTPALDHDAALIRIAVDYIEMPDLVVTARQAVRLWDIPSDVCDTALAALVERGFLARTRGGAFLRRTSDSALPLSQAS